MSLPFKSFLQKFPEIELPTTLSEEDITGFSAANEPIPERLLMDFIIPHEEDDELTEYIACFRLKGTKDFHALVYWKGGIMNYQYIMATFDKSGKLIDKRTIAGTYSDGAVIIRSVAHLDTDMSISIVSGQVYGWEEQYEAANSTTVEIELLPDGRFFEMV